MVLVFLTIIVQMGVLGMEIIVSPLCAILALFGTELLVGHKPLIALSKLIGMDFLVVMLQILAQMEHNGLVNTVKPFSNHVQMELIGAIILAYLSHLNVQVD